MPEPGLEAGLSAPVEEAMNIAVIVNPTAGRGRGMRIWQSLLPAVRESRHNVEPLFTRGAGDATRLAAQTAAAGADRVVSLGGDGTLFETVNGLVGTGAALGVIPGGTGNDFCRAMGIPRTPREALDVAFGDYTVQVDVGQKLDRYFINAAGVGLDAEVCRETNAIPKYFGGTVPYLVGVGKALIKFRPRPVTIDVDGQVTTQPITLLAIANGQYYGAGMHIAPDADPTDGWFDLVRAGDLSLPELLRALPRLYPGTHLSLPKVTVSRGRRVTITSDYPLPVQLDGEVAGTLPVTIQLLPSALTVAAPLDAAVTPGTTR
ncbi:MAG: diacylglycerol kinase family lipid kinase [Firmicutes bacterium]|nr:diacylglycerol kinase family lipid kinase [Bacillota bacterium]